MSALIEAEQAAIGCALTDPVGAAKVCGILRPDDFSDRRLALIFASLHGLQRENKSCGVHEVMASAGRHGITNDDLEWMVSGVGRHHALAERNAKLVLEAAQLRQIVALCGHVAGLAKDAAPVSGTVEYVLEVLRSGIDEIAARFPGGGPVALGAAEPELMRRILDDEETPRGIPTGYQDLDDALGGLRKGEMIVLASRPSVGKSLFACNVAENVAMRESPTPVLILSMEMSASSLYRRALFGRSGVSANAALAGYASQAEKDALRTAHGEIRRARIDVIADAAMTVSRVHDAARRFKARHGDCLVVIDYLGLMRGDGRGIYEQVTALSKACKGIAVDLDIPLLVLAQLNRNAAEVRTKEGVKAQIPTLSDLRDSGAIEQDADVVIFLSRDIQQRESHPCDVSVAKNRPWKTGKLQILFDTTGPRFRSLPTCEHFDGKS